MEPKLIRTDIAEYVPADYEGTNRSGITPIGDKVLILTDQVKSKTAGNIHLPDDIRERHALAAETGIIVAMGDDAFDLNYSRTRKWSGEKPQVGDHVYIERYSGVVFKGDDGQKYRIMDYTCIGAVRKSPVASEEQVS